MLLVEGRVMMSEPMQSATRRRHQIMVENGLLDPDQPTEWSHQQYTQQMQAEFTPQERQIIRFELGLRGENSDGV